jgi:hypothetical protein
VARFQRDPAFEGLLLRSTGVKVVVDDATQEVAKLAARYALERSRTIAAGIEATGGQEAAGYRGRVNAWDFKSGWAEFGTSRFPQVRMLGRALEEIVGPVRGD